MADTEQRGVAERDCSNCMITERSLLQEDQTWGAVSTTAQVLPTIGASTMHYAPEQRFLPQENPNGSALSLHFTHRLPPLLLSFATLLWPSLMGTG